MKQTTSDCLASFVSCTGMNAATTRLVFPGSGGRDRATCNYVSQLDHRGRGAREGIAREAGSSGPA